MKENKLNSIMERISKRAVTDTIPNTNTMIYAIKPEVMTILGELAYKEYYQMSFYNKLASLANNLGFMKAEKYLLEESAEERTHFLGHYDYIVGRGENITIPALESPQLTAKSLYEIVMQSLQMEIEVSDMYQMAAAKVFGMDQMTYNHLLEYIEIQQGAVKFYIDACATLSGLEKTGELVAEQSIF